MINIVRNKFAIRGALLAGVCGFFTMLSAHADTPASEETAAVKSFAAIVVGVSDVDTALEFYTSVLDLKLVREVNTEKYREKILSTASGDGTKIVLFQTLTDTALPATRVVFYSDDVNGIISDMRDRDLEVIIEPSSDPGAPAIVGIARDADGTVLEFIQLN